MRMVGLKILMQTKNFNFLKLLSILYFFCFPCVVEGKQEIYPDIDCTDSESCDFLMGRYFQSLQLGRAEDAQGYLLKAINLGSGRAMYNYYTLYKSFGVGAKSDAERYLKDATISSDCSVSIVASDLYAGEVIGEDYFQDKIKYLEYSASYGYIPSEMKLIYEYRKSSPKLAMAWLEVVSNKVSQKSIKWKEIDSLRHELGNTMSSRQIDLSRQISKGLAVGVRNCYRMQ